MNGNPIREKSYAFALQVVGLNRKLVARREYVLSRQLLKAGTSIGANVEEALAGQSRRDFRAKMGIASKEARESLYWLRLIADSGTLPSTTVAPLVAECDELIRLLTAIVKSTGRSP